MKVYIFDLDGTLANLDHRLHLIQCDNPDWDAFFAACVHDGVYEYVAEVARALSAKALLLGVSGRSDKIRRLTEDWLRLNKIPILQLYMRKEGDHRPDFIVKRELLAELRADGFEPIMAFDDRDQVVEMWRNNGVPCAQVATGNF